ncbi:DNA-binding transcriptional regulator GlcC (plasmid) [Variovorax sp. SRS16]|uniref:GntR family transcriptional regulator n=1 Tax=Variovorax sp. SRS16 TaxID=282217 RepID=UPI001318B81E|nr:GntR family transcriptional regulator [Variovorax sp. SRS16]VTU46593.1 DNA-binding transcriptional regulator GlcC [Variovorax sp. SRS16]
MADSPPVISKARAIVDIIISDIAAGRLKSGDRLPSERALASKYDISLGTVQRAMQVLAQRGAITREHGRGSFVRGLGASIDTRYLRFRDAKDRNLPLYWHLIDWHVGTAADGVAQFFGAACAIVCIERWVDVDGRFALLSKLFLRRKDFDALFRDDEPRDDTNLRELISQRLSLPTMRIEQRMAFEPLDADVGRFIGSRAGAKGFMLELRGYTVRDRPLSLQRIYGALFSELTLVVDVKVI